jgi:hypothetical protein
MPSRFPKSARDAAIKAIERAGSTDTWAVFQEMYRAAESQYKRDPHEHMNDVWEIYTVKDLQELIKEVSEVPD